MDIIEAKARDAHSVISFSVRGIGPAGLDAYSTVVTIQGVADPKAPGAAIEYAYNLMTRDFPYTVDTVRCWVVTVLRREAVQTASRRSLGEDS